MNHNECFSVANLFYQIDSIFLSELGMLSGVAAILRFPMADLEAEEFEDDSSDSDD